MYWEDVFLIDKIKKSNYKFNNPSEFEKIFSIPKFKKEILITIDDAFLSFYQEAWPYLKKNKIPFILFVSTEPVGKSGYMTWDQIKEVDSAYKVLLAERLCNNLKPKIEALQNQISLAIQEVALKIRTGR